MRWRTLVLECSCLTRMDDHMDCKGTRSGFLLILFWIAVAYWQLQSRIPVLHNLLTIHENAGFHGVSCLRCVRCATSSITSLESSANPDSRRRHALPQNDLLNGWKTQVRVCSLPIVELSLRRATSRGDLPRLGLRRHPGSCISAVSGGRSAVKMPRAQMSRCRVGMERYLDNMNGTERHLRLHRRQACLESRKGNPSRPRLGLGYTASSPLRQTTTSISSPCGRHPIADFFSRPLLRPWP